MPEGLRVKFEEHQDFSMEVSPTKQRTKELREPFALNEIEAYQGQVDSSQPEIPSGAGMLYNRSKETLMMGDF